MPKGYIKMQMTLGMTTLKRMENVKFAVVDIPSAYNVILRRPTLNAFGATVSTRHLVMKFLDSTNRVVTVCGDQRAVRSCYNVSLRPGLKSTKERPQDKAQTSKKPRAQKTSGMKMVAGGTQVPKMPVRIPKRTVDHVSN